MHNKTTSSGLKIKFTKQALLDLDMIYDFIKNDNEQAAKQELEKIKSTILLIGEFPEIGKQGKKTNIREMVVPKSSFLVIYKIIDRIIFILTIFHTSRDIKYK